MLCNICHCHSKSIGKAKILQKHTIEYYRCTGCGFVQTEHPYWLTQAYSESIAASDIGLVGRNIKFSMVTAAIISTLFNTGSTFLDYGGGHGMFVRLMRDKGFNFYWQDQYTPNLFARGFEHVRNNMYDVVTAFEVFEHLENPLLEVKNLLKYSDNILFSTIIMPRHEPNPNEWWYYALDSGQHLSLYTLRSLQELAKPFGLNLYSNGKSLHLLTHRRISKLIFFLLSFTQFVTILWPLFSIGRKSLIEYDYQKITGRLLN